MAAFNYFGKPLSELTIRGDAAYLASLPKGPSNYDPVKRRTAAIGRRNWVLGQMADNGWISRAAAQRGAFARGSEDVQKEPERAHYKDADYFMEEVRQRAKGTLGEKTEQGGPLHPHHPRLASADGRPGRLDEGPGDLRSSPRLARRLGPYGVPGRAGSLQASTKSRSLRAPGTWRAAAVDQGVSLRRRPRDPAQWYRRRRASIDGGGRGLGQGGQGPAARATSSSWSPRRAANTYNLRQVPAVNGAIVALLTPSTGAVQVAGRRLLVQPV